MTKITTSEIVSDAPSAGRHYRRDSLYGSDGNHRQRRSEQVGNRYQENDPRSNTRRSSKHGRTEREPERERNKREVHAEREEREKRRKEMDDQQRQREFQRVHGFQSGQYFEGAPGLPPGY